MTGRFEAAMRRVASARSAASGRGRRTRQTRGSKNRVGQSHASDWTSSGSEIVTAPVSTGSVSTRNASGSEPRSCSGREMRSKKRETGRNASFALASRSVGCSICWSTGSGVRLAK